MSSTRFNVNFEKNFPFSNQTFSVLLAASTALSITIPGVDSQIYRAKFTRSSNAEIWVRLNGTAAIPSSGTSLSTSYQELVPLDESRSVKGGDTLSFISASGSSVSVTLLMVQDIT